MKYYEHRTTKAVNLSTGKGIACIEFSLWAKTFWASKIRSYSIMTPSIVGCTLVSTIKHCVGPHLYVIRTATKRQLFVHAPADEILNNAGMKQVQEPMRTSVGGEPNEGLVRGSKSSLIALYPPLSRVLELAIESWSQLKKLPHAVHQ
jgi:hypothetical protein